jgi:hypothetical protein
MSVYRSFSDNGNVPKLSEARSRFRFDLHSLHHSDVAIHVCVCVLLAALRLRCYLSRVADFP